MEELDVVTLEDNQDYIVTDEILINGIKYVFLTNEKDVSSFCIRKVNIINNEEYLIGLDNKTELENTLNEFYKHHQEPEKD
jgi:hypothetical protein